MAAARWGAWGMAIWMGIALASPASAQLVRCQFADRFESASFGNQDGTLAWSGPWIELDPAGSGPNAGNALVTGGELSLDDFSNTNVDIAVERELDLSRYGAAVLRFSWRTTSGVDANDAVFVEASDDGGTRWTVLERITGVSGAQSGVRSYSLAPYLAADTRIRIRVDGLNGTGGTSCCYGASGENFLIDELTVTVDAACSTDHFAISHAGSTPTCGVEPVTIERHDGSENLDSSYSGTASISTSTGNGTWSLLTGSGTFVPLVGGQATYSFAPGDAGRVVLGLSHSVAARVDIDVVDGAVRELPAEDPPLVFAGSLSTNFRDQFDTISYSNNDGAQNFSTPWLEINEADGPNAGDEQVLSGWLRVRNNDGGGEGVGRELDLSAYTGATLRFDYRRWGLDSSADFVAVSVSDNGGATWTELERFAGPASDPAFTTVRYDLTAFLSAQTRIRFLSSPTLGGSDQVFFDDFEVEAFSAVNCGPDHFSIVHDGSGVHCQAEPVTIVAHDTIHSIATSFSDAISLSTSTAHGDWSLIAGAGALTNSGNGNATYQYDLADAGEVTLGLRNTFSEALSIDVSGGGASEAVGEDPGLAFASAGFQFLADGAAGSVVTQIAGKPSDRAPGAQALELQAIRTSPVTGACEAAFQGNETIEFGFRCQDPTTCSGAQLAVAGVPLPPTDAAAPLSYAVVDLDFGDPTDTTAPFVMVYPDVGRVQLHARHILSPSGERMMGASAPFVSRPFALFPVAVGNPAAADENGGIYTSAGSNFDAQARALQWQAADDGNGDGVADGHDDADPNNNAPLQDNPLAPSFGREQNAEAARLAASLAQPVGGNDPGLGGTVLLNNWNLGLSTTTAVFFDEVGIAELRAELADGDYLGIGAASSAAITGRSGPVGRFSPADFAVSIDTDPMLANGCAAGAFHYVGQPFGYATPPVLRVAARSARGTPIQNYRGAWWKITNASLGPRIYTADPTSPVALDASGIPDATVDPSITDLGNGSGTLRFDLGSGLRFSRGGAVAPFDAEISLRLDVIDADSVAFSGNPFQVGAPSSGNGFAWDAGKSQRYGRIRLHNAYGSELSPLPQALGIETWTGLGFSTHGDDACTAIGANHVGTPARSAGLATTPTVQNNPVVSGDAGLIWSAPGTPGFADVLINLGDTPIATPFGSIDPANLPWLQWDWAGEGAGTPDQNPTGRMEFGIFSDGAPVIFRREVY